MACFYPSEGWLSVYGGRPLCRFPVGESPYDYVRCVLYCRKCIGCLAVRAREIGLRAGHEAQIVGRCSFLTLTYDNEHIPALGSLDRRDVELWFKRLRKYCAKRGNSVRAYFVGEYGGRTLRPHYHVCLFGEDFREDWRYRGRSTSGYPTFESETLTNLWGKGLCTVNEMGVEVAQYAAKYSMKALGARAPRRCDSDGKWHSVVAPFDSLPHGRALGTAWLDRYWSDVFPHGYCVLKGGVMLPAPKAYMKLFRDREPEAFADLQARRMHEVLKRLGESMPARLAVREEVLRARVSQKERGL